VAVDANGGGRGGTVQLETPSGPDKKPSFKRNLERLRALVGAPRPTEPPPKQELPDDGKKKKDSRQQSLF